MTADYLVNTLFTEEKESRHPAPVNSGEFEELHSPSLQGSYFSICSA